ncbi:MAG: hypothetical protein RML38_10650 [Bacteroidia bacterium]|nr:hypothetical protein [Bacteroidia bacterium]
MGVPLLRKGRGVPHYASLRCSANATHCSCGHAPCLSRRLPLQYIVTLFKLQAQVLTS